MSRTDVNDSESSTLEKLNLNILISTFNERIGQVKNVLLKRRADVKYIIFQSYTDKKYIQVPEELIREDVVVRHIPEKGISHSVNQSIKMADADIALFSDDDVTYTSEYIDRIINIYSADNSLDIAIFKIKTLPGDPEYKNYSTIAMKINKLPYSISFVEMTARISKIKEKGILFDERFGTGNKLIIGSEESVFISDCIKAGLNVWYFPEYIVQHPFVSTVKEIPKYDKRRVNVIGAYDSRINGWISIPKAFLGTIKHLPDLIQHRKCPFRYLKERLFAAIYILFSKPFR